jgi:hypothetical protein
VIPIILKNSLGDVRLYLSIDTAYSIAPRPPLRELQSQCKRVAPWCEVQRVGIDFARRSVAEAAPIKFYKKAQSPGNRGSLQVREAVNLSVEVGQGDPRPTPRSSHTSSRKMRLFLSLWDNLPHLQDHLDSQQHHHQYFPLLMHQERMLHTNETSLTQYSNNTTTSNTNVGRSNGPNSHSFEFVAFLVWYLVLVGCCIIPTCCSYRRRRLAEQRYLLHQANLHRMQQNGLFVLSNFHYRTSEDGSPYIVRRYNSERIQQERLRILTEELQNTTVVRVFAFLPLLRTLNLS